VGRGSHRTSWDTGKPLGGKEKILRIRTAGGAENRIVLFTKTGEKKIPGGRRQPEREDGPANTARPGGKKHTKGEKKEMDLGRSGNGPRGAGERKIGLRKESTGAVGGGNTGGKACPCRMERLKLQNQNG